MNVLQRKYWIICSQAPKPYGTGKVQRPAVRRTLQANGGGNGVGLLKDKLKKWSVLCGDT